MLDFLRISTRPGKRGVIEIYPWFVVGKSNDLMIRGRDFYAVYIDKRNEWSTDEDDVTRIVDEEQDNFAAEYLKKHPDANVKICYMKNSSTRIISQWHQYCQKDMRDNFKNLDETITFANDETTRESYSSKRLPYPLVDEPHEAYDQLMSVLYSPEEREKIEWAVGSIITGDSKKIQKFIVLYGSAGTGKSTVLNIIQKLFEGYYSTFDSRALGSSSDSFALEAFKDNPLIAIQHDGDLSRIEDNTRLNSLVSHETMRVNEKFKPTYSNKFISFLFMGTNKPVRITDAKSGLMRRLIDVTPTGNKIPAREYKDLIKRIGFELGGIAWHCREVYLSDPDKYDNYIPVNMMGATNDFYNFVLDQYFNFESEDAITLGVAYERYKQYCTDANVSYPLPRRAFKEELKNYFREFDDRYTMDDGTRIRSYYTGFKKETFNYQSESTYSSSHTYQLSLEQHSSLLDTMLADCPAQYATDEGIPGSKWSNVHTKLSDLDTSRLHYVKVPKNHIVIDFDIKNEAGEKSREKNLEEAAKWPSTYAEFSKGGSGVHLHYIYDGDVSKLKPIYAKDIEVKVFTGGSSLRRRLTMCNDIPVAHISSGLPLKEVKEKTVNTKQIKNEQGLRRLISRHMRKEIMGYTKPSIDMIKKILDEAYENGVQYDLTNDMADALVEFAMSSTHNKEACLKIVNEMKLASEPIMAEPVEPSEDERPITFFDIEVYPNLYLVCWKYIGENNKCVRMFNPTAEEIQALSENRLVGFNCRRYDNHICYGRILGETNEQLYNRSQAIINNDKDAFFGGAYDFSYTDVYDFSSKKQSLKKFEIELGIHHQEMGIPWDQPVPEEMWDKVADYCCNDVIATEAVWNARQADFIAREILADVAGMNVNSTTNSLTTKIIFQGEKHPQSEFNYRDMGDISAIDTRIHQMRSNSEFEALDPQWTAFDDVGRPIFPGYKYKAGKSIYRDEEVGEGGYVYSEPGIYGNVALLDIASMHPSSIIAEELFGPQYTKRFREIVEARIAIKHKDFEAAKNMLGGVLAKYLDDPDKAKALAQALKIAINSVYGLTAAHFDNPFRDKRNKDNIVAKRGALFMVNLKHEVRKRGFIVAHIKTDSIKIPDATPEIIQFVMDYGKLYGYTFEHEDTYERMCLVNDAVYIAKSQDGHWSATGTQFAVPYVFKTLFSHEPIIFSDYCETKAVSGNSSIYLDMNETLGEDEHNYIFVGRVGLFTPIKPGCGGGELFREKDGKYYAVTGTKGYRWLESEMVKELGKEDCIDESYYEQLVAEAKDEIRSYSIIEDVRHGVTDWFFTDIPYKSLEYKDGIPQYDIEFE